MKYGDRVRYSKRAKDENIPPRGRSDRQGTVMTHGKYVHVVWDGNICPAEINSDFVELIPC